MAIENGLSLETRLRIAALGNEGFNTTKILPKYDSDFPNLLAERQKIELKRLNEAKNKLAAANKHVNQPDDRTSLEDIYVPGDDTANLLTLELFGRTGVFTPPEKPRIITGIRLMRAGYEALAATRQRDYITFLGGTASTEIERMAEEVEDFYGPYTYAEPLRVVRGVVALAIEQSSPAGERDLQGTGS